MSTDRPLRVGDTVRSEQDPHGALRGTIERVEHVPGRHGVAPKTLYFVRWHVPGEPEPR